MIVDMPAESPERNNDSLSPETKRAIEGRFESAANQSGLFAEAFLRYLRRIILIVVVFSGITFLVDYVKLRTTPNAFAAVMIKRYYVVGLKNGRKEISMAEPEKQMCVNSVFPHLGYYPCWYLRRHDTKQIDV